MSQSFLPFQRTFPLVGMIFNCLNAILAADHTSGVPGDSSGERRGDRHPVLIYRSEEGGWQR